MPSGQVNQAETDLNTVMVDLLVQIDKLSTPGALDNQLQALAAGAEALKDGVRLFGLAALALIRLERQLARIADAEEKLIP